MRRVALALVLVVTSSIALAKETTPVQLVENRHDEIQKIIAVNKGGNADAVRDKIRKIMESFINYDELGQRTLKGTWDGLKKADRNRFTTEFRKMIQRSYLRRFDPETSFVVGDLVMKDGRNKSEKTVTSILRSGSSEVSVWYEFFQKKGKWWAYDVVIDEVSMVRNYRKQFNDIIKKEGFGGLMARIEKKNQEKGE